MYVVQLSAVCVLSSWLVSLEEGTGGYIEREQREKSGGLGNVCV